jgi:hypothetical protein
MFGVRRTIQQMSNVRSEMFDLIGAYHSRQPLIDGIPVSEDPDLYLAAAELGDRAAAMHAWELAPERYSQGPDGRPVRRRADGGKG